ncbi:hypothetical protein XELAEV_18025404mg [Xenopus laevis]|uniref:Uncharacterized protein n=1 Tax=Xenopus laevis TaxID=8355 RepID=A0A974CZE4_XENLA|nr:hypothetical protein XELAEV_18025404mg [Xenopus laevis]
MSCPNCVCGLLFAITPLGWRLAKIQPVGYPASDLGLGPIFPGFSDLLLYRLNVHFPVNPSNLGDSLLEIRVHFAYTGPYPEVCDSHSESGLDQSEAEAVQRLMDLL